MDITAGELANLERSFLPILDKAFTDHGERECVRFQDQVYSYRQVDLLSRRIANRLRGSGFETGMKGAVYSLNSAMSFIATLGIVRAGGIWIPLNPRNSAQDNLAVLNQFGCEALFYQQAFVELAVEFSQGRNPTLQVACLDRSDSNWPSLEHWIAGANDSYPSTVTKARDLITIPLTGGTTGLPKGVMLSNRNFCALEYATRAMYGDRDPVVLSAAPMTHVGGRIALCGLSSGARFVILETVDSQRFLQAIQDEGITDSFLPPTGIYSLLEQPNLSDFDLSSLVSLSYGSAPMSTERLKEALVRIGPVMRGGFGQTECPMFIARLHPEEHFVDNDISGSIASDQRLRSVGRATMISELGILDEQGRELPIGERGELAVKGPMVSEGYYRSPEETAKVRVNGWHLTGDIGYLDELGYLYIVDRKKDMIISGGFNVYCSEVEQALMEIPGVKLAVVFGIPDDKWGEAVSAQVLLQPGTNLTKDDLIVAAKDRLGGVKAPKAVTFVDEFPRTSVGKIDKKAMRAAVWGDRQQKI